MSMSRLFILRPVATTLAMVALLVAGLLGYRMLPVAALPQVDYPTIQVVTLYPGASPDVVAALVTSPLERRFGSMSGLSQMISSSSGGASRITLQFELGLSLDVAEQEVQAAINAASTMLPNDLPAPPIYNKVNPADTPVISLAVTSPNMPLHEVRDLIDVRVAQKLSQVNGVGLVSIAGGQQPAVRIQADPSALAARNLTLASVRQAIVAANVNQPKGNLDGPQRSTSISANEQLQSVRDYENLIIAYQNDAAVRLGEVATVVRDAQDVRQAAWMGTDPAILLNIQRQPGANVIDVVDRIQDLLPEIRQSLPVGVDVTVATDRTQTIRDSVDHVQKEMLLAIALVVLVTFVFLRTWTATIIPSVVVPISLIGTFAIMFLCGFSVNNLTLMALTIATGFVVDDAIVMIENIARYIEKGESAMQAALKGAAQIGFTLLSLTISLIAVLIPLLFMSDVIGRLFSEFAITLAVAILLSLFISLTLTPMMCARMLTPSAQQKHGRFTTWAGVQMDRLIQAYDKGLVLVLRHQTLTLLVALGTVVLTALLYLMVPKGFFPQQDTGLIQVITQGPQTASFRSMSRLQQEAAAIVLQDPDVQTVTSFIGVDGTNATLNNGRMQIALKPQSSGRASANEIMERLDERLAGIPGLTSYQQSIQELTVDDQISRNVYQLALSDPDPQILNEWMPKWLEAVRALPQIKEASTSLQNDGLQVLLDIDRDAAARVGVTKAAIDDALYDAFGQRLISTIYTQSAQYRVVLEVKEQARQSPQNLEHIYVATSAGNMVPVTSLARVQLLPGALSVERLGQFPAVNASFDLAPGHSLSDAVQAIEAVGAQIGMPDSVDLRYLGAAKAFNASLSSTLWLMLAAVLTMYIVLGILYESYIHPVTILSTLPSAAIGALLALLLAGRDLDMVGVIGIILLIGIVKKNAIMMIDFALEAQREQGLTPRQAIHQAALLRFRPILMTTLAALFSAIPLMFATGSGAELRQPLGLVMVGGLLASQVLTLFTTPVIYLFFDRFTRRSGARGQA
ncbi:MAG TPA: multidrug efflux RND transporter permease subunit [Alcaligenes sp.]|nr:multidrug efflux RND transporter permease subunit [Alcaligenes sp.]HRL26986.1 multidrug efflux RND transporter permease subunit [Alcaligenes sp.]